MGCRPVARCTKMAQNTAVTSSPYTQITLIKTDFSENVTEKPGKKRVTQ